VYELIDHLDNVSAPLKPGEVFSPIENPEVTSEEARALRQTLTDAGFVGGEHGFYAGLFFFNSPDCEDRRRCPPELGITLAPILPHGEWVQWAS
jgi:hypothetical protein